MIKWGGSGCGAACPNRRRGVQQRHRRARWSPLGATFVAVSMAGAVAIAGGGGAIAEEAGGPCDIWMPIGSLGAPNRYTGTNLPYVSVWTGTEMLVWADSSPGDNGAYSPATDTWRRISTVGAPGLFYGDEKAVWTGHQMVTWGHREAPRPPDATPGAPPPEYLPLGGRYDPATDTWRPMSEDGAPTGEGTVVWTGSEMLVWDGEGEPGGRGQGAAYDPVADVWTPLSTDGAPSPRGGYSAVWTGSRMILWGGTTGMFSQPNHGDRNDGAAYNPTADSWAPITSDGAPSPRFGPSAVWAGFGMFVYGGEQSYQNGLLFAPAAGGGLYDPTTDTWRPVSTAGAAVVASFPPNQEIPLLWDGQEVLLWNGTSLYLYNPEADTWNAASTADEPSPRDLYVPMVWTGGEAAIWGGQLAHSQAVQFPENGAAYTPCTGEAGAAPDAGAAPAATGSLPPSK